MAIEKKEESGTLGGTGNNKRYRSDQNVGEKSKHGVVESATISPNRSEVDRYNAPAMEIAVFENDIPAGYFETDCISFDTEAMGLKVRRDRLCVIQACEYLEDTKTNRVAIVKIAKDPKPANNLKEIFENPNIRKIAHFARFDVRIMLEHLGIKTQNVHCTHLMSNFARTYTNNHSLKDVCRDALGVMLNKQACSTDWGSASLTDEQLKYAAGDVLYLQHVFQVLENALIREDRNELYLHARECIIIRAMLDIGGWDYDVFSHHRDPGRFGG